MLWFIGGYMITCIPLVPKISSYPLQTASQNLHSQFLLKWTSQASLMSPIPPYFLSYSTLYSIFHPSEVLILTHSYPLPPPLLYCNWDAYNLGFFYSILWQLKSEATQSSQVQSKLNEVIRTLSQVIVFSLHFHAAVNAYGDIIGPH